MKNFLPIFKVLDDSEIRYVTVGGIATILNGYPRLTGDIDLILDLKNEENCRKALAKLNSIQMRPRAPVDIFDFALSEKREAWVKEKGLLVFSLYSPLLPLIEVDLFVTEQIDFEQLWKNSQIVTVQDTKIRFAAIDDLITLKKIASRPKDLEDIENLLLIRDNKL